jgi:hypothetical protein
VQLTAVFQDQAKAVGVDGLQVAVAGDEGDVLAAADNRAPR